MGGAIGAGVYFATHASTSTGYVTGGHTKKVPNLAFCALVCEQKLTHNMFRCYIVESRWDLLVGAR